MFVLETVYFNITGLLKIGVLTKLLLIIIKICELGNFGFFPT